MGTWVTIALTAFYCFWLVAVLWLLWRIYRSTSRSMSHLTEALVQSVYAARDDAKQAAQTVEQLARRLARHLPPPVHDECEDVEENLDADAP
jgi:hypothetical protein